MKKLTDLLSGSDIRGYALREDATPDLTDENINRIAQGIYDWYRNKYNKDLRKVTIGRDSRVTGERILNTLAGTLAQNDIDIIDVGLATSPAMFMLTQEELEPDLSIMITASHMPMNRNGIKIVTPEGGLSSSDIKQILEIAETKEPIENIDTNFTEYNYLNDYANHLVDVVREKTGKETPLEGLNVVIDAGNGAGGFFANQVLQPLGADISGSQFLEPDGTFPNHIPNPEEEEAIESIIAAVKDNQADMGIIFDTDVDRSAIIDEKGNPINKSAYIAFISSILLEDHPGATIVTDSVTSNGLKDFIEAKGGKHRRFKRGYKNVIDEAKRLNAEGQETVLAMETSGHGAVKDNYFLDDGAYLAVLSLIALAKANEQNKTVSEYLKDYHFPLEEKEVRLDILDEDFRKVGEELISDLEEFAVTQPGWSIVEPNYEGVRIDCDAENGDGWLLLRQSLHEPKIPINIESDTEGGTELIEERLDEFLSKYPNVK